MQIDERIVLQMPKSATKKSLRGRKSWLKRAAMRAAWEVRNKVLAETGKDVFNVSLMDDCAEVRIKGFLEAGDA